jgi:two-component system, chemotaxis family, chemotaxis protein CheY
VFPIAYNPAMAKKVLLIGHCGPDSTYLRLAIRAVDPQAVIVSADTEDDLAAALGTGVDLLLANRVLDTEFSGSAAGVDLIRRVHAAHPSVACMLISNHADAQAAATAVGAIPGFGKRDIGSPAAKTALKTALGVQP